MKGMRYNYKKENYSRSLINHIAMAERAYHEEVDRPSPNYSLTFISVKRE